MKGSPSLLLVALLSAPLLAQAAEPEQCQTVRFSDVGWTDITATTALAAACTRPLREGGWDLAQHQARPVQSLLAPGSVLYAQNLSGDSLPSTAFAAAADASGRGLCLAGVL